MTLPERNTPEWDKATDRINRKVMTTVSNIAVRRGDLSGRVHVVVHDDATQERFSSSVKINYIGDGEENSRIVHLRRAGIDRIRPGVSPRRIAEALIEESPDTPLVLDDTLAKELSTDPAVLIWTRDDHYSVMGLNGDTVEVFTPYRSHQLPGMPGIQIFDE